jgi:hypothetical protein
MAELIMAENVTMIMNPAHMDEFHLEWWNMRRWRS